jgi:hypothetical protein
MQITASYKTAYPRFRASAREIWKADCVADSRLKPTIIAGYRTLAEAVRINPTLSAEALDKRLQTVLDPAGSCTGISGFDGIMVKMAISWTGEVAAKKKLSFADEDRLVQVVGSVAVILRTGADRDRQAFFADSFSAHDLKMAAQRIIAESILPGDGSGGEDGRDPVLFW